MAAQQTRAELVKCLIINCLFIKFVKQKSRSSNYGRTPTFLIEHVQRNFTGKDFTKNFHNQSNVSGGHERTCSHEGQNKIKRNLFSRLTITTTKADEKLPHQMETG